MGQDSETASVRILREGAKATTWEITSRRCGPDFFAEHTVGELESSSDHALEESGRLTHPLRRYLPLGTGNIAINLLIAAAMIALLVVFLMDLRNAKAVLRLVAAAGLFRTIMMFALTFNDYLSRHY